MAQQSAGIPAASGYPQFAGNFIHPMVSMKLIEDFYCESVFGEISTTEYQGEFSKGGDQITFWTAPGAIARKYVKNGPMKADVLDSKPITITIDCAQYVNMKIDCIDQFQIQNWDAIKAAWMENAKRAMVSRIDEEILGSVYTEVASSNQGANAGCMCKSINLGEFGAPVELTAENMLSTLVDMSTTLDEQCVPAEGRFVVLPYCFKSLIFNGPLACADCSGLPQSLYLNGRLPTEIMGFKIYFTRYVQPVEDSSNRRAWNILFGLRDATVFATQMEKMRMIDDHESFDEYVQMLQVYGFDVIRPQMIGHLYATLA